MDIPETRYAKTPGGVHIAYQAFGQGPITLVVVHPWLSNIEVFWEWPGFTRLMHKLGSEARVIHFDKRGTGLSDRVTELPDMETRMDDIRVVMECVGGADSDRQSAAPS